MLGGIFNVVLLLMILIATILIYSLLMHTADTKVYQNGVLRILGTTKQDCILQMLMQSLTFVVPSLLIAYVIACSLNFYLLK